MLQRRVFGTTRTTLRRTARAFSLVSLQCTIVNVAAASFRNLPTGSCSRPDPAGSSGCAPRVCSGGFADRERQQPEAALARSRSDPRRSTLAPQIGGCGSWNGFGCTRRRHRPVLARELVLARWSSSRRCGASASLPHLARLVRVDAEAFDLRGVDDRPVPNSTRPPEMRSRAATDSRSAYRMVVRLRAAGGRRNRGAGSSVTAERWP